MAHGERRALRARGASAPHAIQLENVEALRNRKVFAWACQTGAELGPAAARAGVVWFVSRSRSLRPQKIRGCKSFLLASCSRSWIAFQPFGAVLPVGPCSTTLLPPRSWSSKQPACWTCRPISALRSSSFDLKHGGRETRADSSLDAPKSRHDDLY